MRRKHLVFIKLPVPEDFLSRGGELKEAVVWSCDTLHTDINMFIHKYSMLLSHSFVGFGFLILFLFLVLGKEPGFGFGGVWLSPDHLWCPPARGRLHFWKVSENDSHDPLHS